MTCVRLGRALGKLYWGSIADEGQEGPAGPRRDEAEEPHTSRGPRSSVAPEAEGGRLGTWRRGSADLLVVRRAPWPSAGHLGPALCRGIFAKAVPPSRSSGTSGERLGMCRGARSPRRAARWRVPGPASRSRRPDSPPMERAAAGAPVLAEAACAWSPRSADTQIRGPRSADTQVRGPWSADTQIRVRTEPPCWRTAPEAVEVASPRSADTQIRGPRVGGGRGPGWAAHVEEVDE